MARGDKSKDFMERVVVWPGAKDAPGWINLHSHMKNRRGSGKDFVVGWVFKTVDEFMGYARWIGTTDSIYDVWFCTAQQLECATGRTGKPKALRRATNATWLKAIWLDVDIESKPGDWDPAKPWPKYESIAEAWQAVEGFRQKVGLPSPSNVVKSGGGLHIYWISNTPLSPADWRPYAEGLKALALQEGLKVDAGLTTDNVRILRVPGTLNHKYTPPAVVEVIEPFGPLYDFPQAIGFLTKHNVAPTKKSSPQLSQVIDLQGDWSAPHPLFAGLTDKLTDGMNHETLLDPAPIFEQCGFLKDALDNGGANFANPLWNLSLLCATFMEDGNDLAHKISEKHPTYDQADTQAQYDRKLVERTERGIGYPSCSTIQSNGCQSCATCPLFAKGKSPLNIRPAFIAGPKRVLGVQTPTKENLNLPDGYDVGADGCIYEIEVKESKNGELITIPRQLFYNVIDMPQVQKEPDIIHFRMSYDKGNTIQAAIRKLDWCGPGFEKKFGEAKINYVPKHKNRLEHFLMSWLANMHAAAVAQTAQPFGWYREDGVKKGFAFGGFIHLENGNSITAGLTDKETQTRFQPTGQLAPWFKAAGYLTMQKRPDLDLILATSFAAPLMDMTGISGALFSAWSTDSGSGKSYAGILALAVWGHPKLTKETTSSTWRNVEKRLGATVNLPLYWDEIHDEKSQKNVFEMVMTATTGVSGGRLKQNREFADKETWATLVSINSNICFKDFVHKYQPTHIAGLNRVFEINVKKPKPEDAIGQVQGSIPEQALAELQYHFGGVGLEYSRLLGQDFVAIQARINEVLDEVHAKIKPTEDDRFYVGMAAALIVGAELATRINVDIDVPALTAYLYEQIDKNRNVRAIAAQTTMLNEELGADLLSGYLRQSQVSTIWVDGALPGRTGRTTQLPHRRLWVNVPMPDGVQVRYDTVAKTLSFSKKKFLQYCAEVKGGGGISETSVVQCLEKAYRGAFKIGRGTLGAGTPFNSGGQERVYIIHVTGFSDLEDGMASQGVNQDLGAVVGMSPIDTAGDFIKEGETAGVLALASISQLPQGLTDLLPDT